MSVGGFKMATLSRDEAAAATELGYVFTFLLGLLFGLIGGFRIDGA